MKKTLPVLFLFFLVFLFFAHVIFQKGIIFAPADILYLFEPWHSYKHVIPHTYLQTDAVLQFIPWRLYSYRQLHNLHFPFFNPYEFGGVPFFANDQSAALSPYNLIGLLFNFETGFLILAILKLLVAAVGMYLFLNLFSLKQSSCIIGTIAFTFSSQMIIALYHPISAIASFMPWLFWAGERLFSYAVNSDKQNVFSGITGISLILFLCFLSGHSETTMNVLVGLGLYITTRIIIDGKARMRIIAYFCIALSLGFLLASIHLIPFIQLLLHSEPFHYRSAIAAGNVSASHAHAPVYALLLWLVPNLRGNASFHYFFLTIPILIYAVSAYIGIAPLLLSLSTVRSLKADYRRLVPFWVMILFGFIVAYGVPGFSWLTKLYFLQAGYGFRYIILMVFGFSALSAFGLDILLNRIKITQSSVNNDRKTYILIVLISIVSITLYIVTRHFIKIVAPLFDQTTFSGSLSWLNPERFSFVIIQVLLAFSFVTGTIWIIRNAYKKTITPKVIYGGLMVLTIVDLFIYGIEYNPVVPAKDFYPSTPIIQKLQQLDTKDYTFFASGYSINPDISMAYTIRDFRGYDIIVSNRYQNFLFLLFPEEHPVLGESGGVTLNTVPNLAMASIAGIKYFIFPTTFDVDDKAIPLKLIGNYPSGLSLYENPSAMPLLYTARAIIPSDNDRIALQMLHQESTESFVPMDTVVEGIETAHIFQPDNISLSSIQENPGRFTLEVHAGSDGFLVLNEPSYPGWHAYINDKEVKVYHTNYLFQGINLPQGNYTVRFEYMPEAFVIGFFISIATAGFILSFFVFICLRKRTDKGVPA